jgi:hypothetical protein
MSQSRQVHPWRLRGAGLTVALLLLAAAMPASSDIVPRTPPVAVVIVSPPPGLALPVGQAVAVRYYVEAEAAVLELWADDTLLGAERVQPGQEVAHPWAPTGPGPHRLAVRAFDSEGTLLATAERHVTGLPAGAAVRLRGEE